MGFNPLKDLFDSVEKAINEHGSSVILRERLALLKEKSDILAEENERLKKENTELKDLSVRLANELKAKATSEEFVKHRGAAFKRLPAGGYEKVVYCPECGRSTSSLGSVMPYHCSRCKWSADFTGQDLLGVMTELPK